MRIAVVVGAALLLASTRAGAQPRGVGSGYGSAAEAPVTKSEGPPIETQNMPAADLPIEPRHGIFGAPGAAMDSGGPMRLGEHGERARRPSYGEAPPQGAGTPAYPAGQGYEPWRSGDMVRSRSSADVRSTRQQEAPDLEWAEAGVKNPRTEPDVPFGVKFSHEQEKPLRGSDSR